jgi:hypothetical protein
MTGGQTDTWMERQTEGRTYLITDKKMKNIKLIFSQTERQTEGQKYLLADEKKKNIQLTFRDTERQTAIQKEKQSYR